MLIPDIFRVHLFNHVSFCLFPHLLIYVPPPNVLRCVFPPVPVPVLTLCDSFLSHSFFSLLIYLLASSFSPPPLSLPPFLSLWQAAHCSESISWRQAAVLLQWWGVQHWDCWEPQPRPAMTSWTGKIIGCSRRTNKQLPGKCFGQCEDNGQDESVCGCVCARMLRPHLWF